MSDTTADQSLEQTMTPEMRNLLGRMSPAERAAGRFLRAPDGHDGDGGGDGGSGDGDGSDAGASGADDSGGAGDGDGGAAGDDAAAEGAGKGQEGDGEASLMGGAGKAKEDEGEEGKKADDPDPATLPPEKYELAAPEGFTIDETLLEAADPVFRELGLNNEQANKLMPLVPQFAEKLVAAQTDAHRAMTADWAKEAKKDPEIGGANWGETENLVAKALDRFVGPAVSKDKDGNEVKNPFRQLLDETGLGNHPENIRAWRAIGEQLGEGGDFVRSDAAAAIKKPREEVLYGAKGD